MFKHTTVLLKETVDGLNIKPDGSMWIVPLGGAGHSEYLASQLSVKGTCIASTRMKRPSAHAKENLKLIGRVTFVQSNFRTYQRGTCDIWST